MTIYYVQFTCVSTEEHFRHQCHHSREVSSCGTLLEERQTVLIVMTAVTSTILTKGRRQRTEVHWQSPSEWQMLCLGFRERIVWIWHFRSTRATFKMTVDMTEARGYWSHKKDF